MIRDFLRAWALEHDGGFLFIPFVENICATVSAAVGSAVKQRSLPCAILVGTLLKCEHEVRNAEIIVCFTPKGPSTVGSVQCFPLVAAKE